MLLLHWLFVISCLFYISETGETAKVNSEHDATALVESMMTQLHELESEVQKQYANGKVKWQMETFQKWYADSQQCPRAPSYIFHDWTVVQRRMNGSLSFHRNWLDYRQGFGTTDGEIFLGLEKLHSLTTDKGSHELLILLGDHEGHVAYAKYDNFVVAGEQKKYELMELGEYSGDAGDSLRYHVGKKFSTFDQDNNEESERCENVWTGAWWFGACYESNLNGNYLHSKTGSQAHKGIVWQGWHGSKYSLKFVQMMISPKE